MCGIYGCNLKSNTSHATARTALAKVKVLGLYNKSRGRDSCGVFIDGQILKGVGVKKEFDDFIEKTLLPTPKQNFTIIGHDRWSTRGAHTERNAHPFLVNDDLVGVHNGTIQNIDDLCKKYELNPKDYDVDSLALYTLIEKEGVRILNEYVGYAALAFTYLSDPNTLYIYHGASKNYKLGNLIEERPLYFMEAEEGTYFSSMEDSLLAIKDREEDEIFVLEYNTVFQLKNGRFTKNQIVIERDENNITATSTNSRVGNSHRASNNQGCGMSTKTGITNVCGTEAPAYESAVHEPTILRETLPQKVLTNKEGGYIYYHRSRYWEYKRKLCQGPYNLLDRGVITDTEIAGSKTLFFWRGVLLKGEKEYRYLLDLEKTPSSFVNNKHMNFAAIISRFSRFPVTNLLEDAIHLQPYFRWAWYQEDRRYTGTFTPKYSGRHYTIADGCLKQIKPSQQKEEVLFGNYGHATVELKSFLNGDIAILGADGGAPSTESFRDIDPLSGKRDISSSEELINAETEFGRAFIEQADQTEDGRGDDTSLKYWYETSFSSFEEAMEEIGNLEAAALRRYVRNFLERNTPEGLEVEDREVELTVCDLILASIRNKESLLDMCDSEEDRHALRQAYQYVLDDNLEKQFMYNARSVQTTSEIKDDKLPFEVDDAPNDPTVEYIEDIHEVFPSDDEEVNEKDMNAIEVMHDVTDTLGNIVAEAEALTADAESELGQEAAAALYKGVHSMQAQLTQVAERFGEKELLGKLKAINKKAAEG
jgi:hypothetical protein